MREIWQIGYVLKSESKDQFPILFVVQVEAQSVEQARVFAKERLRILATNSDWTFTECPIENAIVKAKGFMGGLGGMTFTFNQPTPELAKFPPVKESTSQIANYALPAPACYCGCKSKFRDGSCIECGRGGSEIIEIAGNSVEVVAIKKEEVIDNGN